MAPHEHSHTDFFYRNIRSFIYLLCCVLVCCSSAVPAWDIPHPPRHVPERDRQLKNPRRPLMIGQDDRWQGWLAVFLSTGPPKVFGFLSREFKTCSTHWQASLVRICSHRPWSCEKLEGFPKTLQAKPIAPKTPRTLENAKRTSGDSDQAQRLHSASAASAQQAAPWFRSGPRPVPPTSAPPSAKARAEGPANFETVAASPWPPGVNSNCRQRNL